MCSVISVYQIVTNFLRIVEVRETTLGDFQLVVGDRVNVQGEVQEKDNRLNGGVLIHKLDGSKEPGKDVCDLCHVQAGMGS